MSQRPTRSTTLKTTTSGEEQDRSPIQVDDKPAVPPSNSSFSSKALTSTANLANLLPTSTLLAFQLLIPSFTNNGFCDPTMKFMSQIVLVILAASAFLACFTDSFHSKEDNQVYYGFATRRGMWLFDYPTTNSPLPDLSKYRMRVVDWVHGVLSVLVFGSVALRDKNVVSCFYPQAKHETQEVLDVVPLAVGLLGSLLFLVFPTRRHGIGYPVTNNGGQ